MSTFIVISTRSAIVITCLSAVAFAIGFCAGLIWSL